MCLLERQHVLHVQPLAKTRFASHVLMPISVLNALHGCDMLEAMHIFTTTAQCC